jgi:hypothetical protein
MASNFSFKSAFKVTGMDVDVNKKMRRVENENLKSRIRYLDTIHPGHEGSKQLHHRF